MSRIVCAALLAAGLTAMNAPAGAGVIPNGTYHAAAGGAGTASATVNNNFLPGVRLNSVGKVFNTPGAIDIVYRANNSVASPTSTYATSEGVTNSILNVPIVTYTIQLGTGTGAGFTQGTLPAGLMFGASPTPSSPNFTLVGSTADTLSFVGFLAPGQVTNFQFSIIVPNNPGVGSYNFTMRETSTIGAVPEPSTLALSGLGLLGLLAYRRFRPQVVVTG